MEQQNQIPKVMLTGLWRKKTKNGDTYLTGSLSPTTTLMIFPNTRKQNENSPDYTVYLLPRSRDDQRAAPAQQNRQPQRQEPQQSQYHDENDIPF